MNPSDDFHKFRQHNLSTLHKDITLSNLSKAWIQRSMENKYVYHFDSLGRPIIQFPQDIVAVQEIIWRCKPDLIIETGIAHGGSLINSASMLALLDICETSEGRSTGAPQVNRRRVLGIDIEIRPHNLNAIESHPLNGYLNMIEGSSISPKTLSLVREFIKPNDRVMVCLDSMHTHDHVLAELQAYSEFVSPGQYLIVFDTFVEDLPPNFFADRPWDVGNSPRTAVDTWLLRNSDFKVDQELIDKLQITSAPGGYLIREK